MCINKLGKVNFKFPRMDISSDWKKVYNVIQSLSLSLFLSICNHYSTPYPFPRFASLPFATVLQRPRVSSPPSDLPVTCIYRFQLNRVIRNDCSSCSCKLSSRYNVTLFTDELRIERLHAWKSIAIIRSFVR